MTEVASYDSRFRFVPASNRWVVAGALRRGVWVNTLLVCGRGLDTIEVAPPGKLETLAYQINTQSKRFGARVSSRREFFDVALRILGCGGLGLGLGLEIYNGWSQRAEMVFNLDEVIGLRCDKGGMQVRHACGLTTTVDLADPWVGICAKTGDPIVLMRGADASIRLLAERLYRLSHPFALEEIDKEGKRRCISMNRPPRPRS